MLMQIMTLGALLTVGQSKPHASLELSENGLSTSSSDKNYFDYIPRSVWGAREPKDIANLSLPVPYVVIHHSYIPKACYDLISCCTAMKSMQNFHMDDRDWWDIGYNFAVGSDGSVYEGRGWTHLGAHSLGFNTVSIGIVLIGDWTIEVPPKVQVKSAQSLIEQGVDLGRVKKDYKLVGHKQVRDGTECPGAALDDQLKQWPHHTAFPATAADLLKLPDLPTHVLDRLRLLNNATGST